MKLTVYDRKANTLAGQRDRLANLIEDETRFGMGCEFKQRREHDVMDEDWSVSPVTNRLRASRIGRALLWIWAAAIALSTVLTHQHHVVDVISGWFVGLAAYRLTGSRTGGPSLCSRSAMAW